MKRWYLFFLCFFSTVYPKTVGSDTSVARQGKSFFPNEASNKLFGFSLFKNGFILADENTLAEFSAYFPVSGDIVLNGGTLTLQSDLTLQSLVAISSFGTIDGNKFSINLPHNVSTFYFPSEHHEKVIMQVDQLSLSKRVFSCDWSYDNKYLALGLDASSGVDELQIYELVNDVLVLRISEDFGSSNDVRAVAWHPSSYYLATGATSGNELQTWFFDPEVPSLTEIDNDNTNDIYAVQWSPDGNYLGAVRYSTDLYVYPVTNGVLGSQVSVSFGKNVTGYDLSWSSDSDYIVVGLRSGSSDELQIFSFDGSSLALDVSEAINSHVYATAWHPTASLLAVGTSASSDQLELYAHSGGSLTRIDSALVGETKTVQGLDWSADGNFLAVSKESDANGLEIEIFNYDSINQKLYLVSGIKYDADADAIAWSPDGNYLVASDVSGKCTVFKFDYGTFTLKDTKIVGDSGMIFTTPVQFEGSCIINANGNTVDLAQTASFSIKADSQLLITNAIIKGMRDSNIACESESSVLKLQDVVWVQEEDYLFDQGSIIFDRSVKMMGDAIFAYQTAQTSTIKADARVTLSNSITFSYDPGTELKTLLEFEDSSSELFFNGATLHSVSTGMQFTKGSIIIKGESFVCSETKNVVSQNNIIKTIDNGITFGDGISSNDCWVTISIGSIWYLAGGSLYYNNGLPTRWLHENDTAQLKVGFLGRFVIQESLTLNTGLFVFEDMARFGVMQGKEFIGSIVPRGKLFRQKLKKIG